MKINVNKHLRVVLMLLALCPLFLASGCDEWESVTKLDKSYNKSYKVTKIQTWDSTKKAWTDRDYKKINAGQIEVTDCLAYNWGFLESRVGISDLSYQVLSYANFPDGHSITISTPLVRNSDGDATAINMGEMLGNLEICKVGSSCEGDYRASGYWGGGSNVKDYNVDYYFSGYKMEITFTDKALTDKARDRSRDFKLFCN